MKTKIIHLKKSTILILLFLVLSSFFIRLAFVSDCLFHHDSVQMANAVQRTIRTKTLQQAVSGRYGLVLINTGAYLLFRNIMNRDIDYILNLTTIIFASLSVGMLYLFIKKLTKNNRIAVITSLLFSFTPIFLSITVYAKSHGIAFFFAILSGYYLLKYIETDRLSDKGLFVLLFLFSLTIRNTNIYYAFPFLILSLFFRKKPELKKRFIHFSLPVAVCIILYFAFNLASFTYEVGVNRIPYDLSTIAKLQVISMHSVYSTITMLGVLAAALAIYAGVKKRKYREVLLFSVIWFFPYYLYMSLLQTFSARFLVPVVAPLMLILGVGIDYVYQRKKILSVLLIIFLLISFGAKILPIISFRHNYCGPKEFALFAKNITEKDSYIISGDEGIFFNYYADRKTLGYPIAANKTELSEAVKNYYSLLKANNSIYVTGKILFETDDFNSSYRTLNKNFILENRGNSINEEYHHAELMLRKRNESLYQIKINPDIPFQKFRVYYYK